jgi:cell division protein FtsB
MNRRRHANVVPMVSITTWILLSAFAGGAGLYYVYCKNQLHSSGSLIKGLETEVAELRKKDEAVVARISLLASHNALRKRREQDHAFLANYKEITREHLVVMSDKPAAGDLRPVANTGQ